MVDVRGAEVRWAAGQVTGAAWSDEAAESLEGPLGNGQRGDEVAVDRRGDAALAQIAPSPIVELNRAVAVAMAFGPAAGLELVDGLVASGELATYHLLPAVRGDLLAKLGRSDEAARELRRAAPSSPATSASAR